MIVKGRARGTQEHFLGYTGYSGTLSRIHGVLRNTL
jgi:hypothetical protein